MSQVLSKELEKFYNYTQTEKQHYFDQRIIREHEDFGCLASLLTNYKCSIYRHGNGDTINAFQNTFNLNRVERTLLIHSYATKNLHTHVITQLNQGFRIPDYIDISEVSITSTYCDSVHELTFEEWQQYYQNAAITLNFIGTLKQDQLELIQAFFQTAKKITIQHTPHF